MHVLLIRPEATNAVVGIFVNQQDAVSVRSVARLAVFPSPDVAHGGVMCSTACFLRLGSITLYAALEALPERFHEPVVVTSCLIP